VCAVFGSRIVDLIQTHQPNPTSATARGVLDQVACPIALERPRPVQDSRRTHRKPEPTGRTGLETERRPARFIALYPLTLTPLNEIVKYPVQRWTPLMFGRIA
jgi:hypothetical protein